VPPPEVPGHESARRASGRPQAGHPDTVGPDGRGERPRAIPPSRAAALGTPFSLPEADWRWRATIVGFIVATAPQLFFAVSDLIAGGTSASSGKATAGDAVVIAIASLVIYGWNALAAWLFSLRAAGRSLVLWGFRRPTRAYFWVVPLGLATAYAFGIVHDAIVHPHQQQIVSDFPHTTLGAVMFVLVAVVMAPIFEEILFRAFLFRGLANSCGWAWGAVISGAIFGAAHLQLDVFLPLAVLGFILAWAYRQTGSLWTNITMHALFNAIAVLGWAFLK
jgi:membrane protease YdiL (CAAX protease family)